jgi:hypothetical protein
VDATSSRKKSPRSLRKSETQTTSVGSDTPPQRSVASELDSDPYDERSIDLVARVRAARDAAERKMDAFGDPADYVVRKIHPSPVPAPVENVVASPTADPQQSFPFESATPVANGFDPKGKE